MPTHEQEMLRCARTVARLQARRRHLRRELKKLESDLKLEKRNLRALVSDRDERRPDVFPSRVFGDGVGHAINDANAFGKLDDARVQSGGARGVKTGTNDADS